MTNKQQGVSVAPKERINIKYVPTAGGQQAEIELPLTMMVVGNMKGRTEETPIEERQTVPIDKNNFSSVMKESALELKLSVPNRLEENSQDDLQEVYIMCSSIGLLGGICIDHDGFYAARSNKNTAHAGRR